MRQHYSAQYPDDAARNRHPTVMLKVTVLPSSVDVNLTPDKTQVLLHEKVTIFCLSPERPLALPSWWPAVGDALIPMLYRDWAADIEFI